ncbi:cobalamin B12-binding domain-containing protein [Methylorubrum zatmanii]|uniref:B12-binding domain-containing protein n=1 Tax=Methylorubrum zatmanii TaxID=29429 RepID=A0ABW1WMJ7_9HYPH|nr:cobalamin-dependent protein [Methylorubrum zatmanii]MBD8906626.1 cobalamin-binding protein [Methylorubrum zatmanii]
MGGWRHFGERLGPPAVSPGCGVLAESPVATPFECDPDADGMRNRLASVVEAEILPRLMLAHRGQCQPRVPPSGERVAAEEVERLCELLLARSDTDLAFHLLRFLDKGLTLEGVLVELLTPVARQLGRLWEEDSCDFLDITVALGRLQAAARDLCGRFEGDATEPAGRSVLLLPCPGETHVFGLSIVGTIFREAGWDVTSAGSGAEADPVEMIRSDWFDVVGLTLSCDVLLPALPSVIHDLRAASCNPAVKVLVGGPYFARNPNQVRLIGADATAEDGRLAPLIAESLLEMRVRAC